MTGHDDKINEVSTLSNAKNFIDLTGLRFGKLTVISRDSTNSKSGNAKWLCKCDCGNVISVIGSKLKSSHTSSCGCKRISETACGHAKERLYRIWHGINQRCTNENADNYKWYGARGIRVCDEWIHFIAFREWAITHGYEDGLSIDRINPNGDYCPDNCQWVSVKDQQNNKTNNRTVEYENKKYTIAQFAEKLCVPYYTIRNQMKLGWSLERIAIEARRYNDKRRSN